MADKLLKSIKFPTLPDRYVIGDSTLTEEGAAADAKAVGEALAKKADTNGRYEDLIVGGAEQLMADGYESDSEPYLFRPTGGSADVGNREYLDKIVGGTVAWNQLVTDGNFTDASSWITNNATMTVSNNIGTVTQNNSGGYVNKKVYTASGHRCLAMLDIKGVAGKTYSFNNVLANLVADGTWQTRMGIFTASDATTYFVISQRGEGVFPAEWQIRNACIFDLTAMFGSTIADYIYSLEQSQAGAGVAWFRNYFSKDYYPYDPGTLRSVEGVSAHGTVWFNQFDKSTATDGKKMSSTTGAPVENNTWAMSDYIKVVPNMDYYTNADGTGQDYVVTLFDANKEYIGYRPITTGVFNTGDARYVVVSTIKARTSIDNLVVNLSDPTRNGEYEPYTKHTYPLDSSLTLRGVPKLVDGKLAFDGDVYPPSGEVQRRYGTATFNGSSSESWSKSSSALNGFYISMSALGMKEYGTVVNSYGYPQTFGVNYYYNNYGRVYTDYTFGINIDPSLCGSTVESFKTYLASHPITIVYELATPTTETAEGYEHYQICDPSGTEEFVTTGIVPVGHQTRYPHDLKKKIETAPDSPSTDGTYLMKRSGGKNSYMALPSTPSANGAYVLTVTVSGGSASYSWTAKE